MANIDIKDLATLNLDGNDLFTDSESFMIELSDSSDRDLILGGDCLTLTCYHSHTTIDDKVFTVA